MKAFSTRHDDLREAHLASHSCGAVHQVREVLPYLMDVSRQQLQSHPQACWCIQGEEEEDVRASHCLSHQTAPGQDTETAARRVAIREAAEMFSFSSDGKKEKAHKQNLSLHNRRRRPFGIYRCVCPRTRCFIFTQDFCCCPPSAEIILNWSQRPRLGQSVILSTARCQKGGIKKEVAVLPSCWVTRTFCKI